MINHYTGSFAPAAGQLHLCLEDFERADIRVAERRFGPRDIIYAPGDPDGQLHFLLGGTVRLYKIYGEYKEATVALLAEGDVFGELSLEERSCQNAFAAAVTDARVAAVRKSVLNEVIKRSPEFALKLFSSFSERLRQSDDRKSPGQGGIGASGPVTLAPGRPLRGALRLGHGSQDAPHPPGSGEHDLLHPGGRLQGDERVSARRSHRGTEPQDIRYPAAGEKTT
jgi:hypothetical protein